MSPILLFCISITLFVTIKSDDIYYTQCGYKGYENWVTDDNKTCYWMSGGNEQTRTWHDSNQECQSYGAQLASIHDEATNQIISQIMHQILHYGYNVNIINMWIGLNSLARRGYYKWSDGSEREYTNFPVNGSVPKIVPTQNAHQDIYFQGRCVYMQVLTIDQNVTFSFWYYEECNQRYRYLCKKVFANNSTTPTPTVIINGNCQTGWRKYAEEKCIFLLNSTMEFIRAKARCHAMDAELLSIHSQEEQNFITALLPGRPRTYIGLTPNIYSQGWTWDDQSPMTYTNWGKQQIIDTSGYSCAALNPTELQAGKWFLTTCNNNHSAICEKRPDPQITVPAPEIYINCTIAGFGTNGNAYHQYRQSCYSIVDDASTFRSWDDAEEWCEQQGSGAHLVSVKDAFESSFLMYHLVFNTKVEEFWIGMYADANGMMNSSMLFKWRDYWPVYYTNWAENEPPFNYATDRTCVYVSRTNGTWKTAADCRTNRAFICKVTQNQLPVLNQELDAVCPKFNNTIAKNSYQWIDLDKRSKYCYWFSADLELDQGLVSWTVASYQCAQRNGTLASVHSYHDLLLFSNKVVNEKNKNANNTWIGLYQETTGEYVWEDESSLDYTYWDDPSRDRQKTSNSDGNCVSVQFLNLTWRESGCGDAYFNYYICQTNKISLSTAAQQSSSRVKVGEIVGYTFGGIVLLAIAAFATLFVIKSCKLNRPKIWSFENSLYSSRRSMGPRAIDAYDPKVEERAPNKPPRSKK